MTDRDRLNLRYLTSSQNRLRMIINSLTEENIDNENPTGREKTLQGEVKILYEILVQDIIGQTQTLQDLLNLKNSNEQNLK